MKSNNRKNTERLLALRLIFLSSGILAAMLLYQFGQYLWMERIGGDLYSGNAAFFVAGDSKEVLPAGRCGSAIWYREINNLYKGVYFEQEGFSVPLLSGRFFRPEDFCGVTPCAVIGQSHLPQTRAVGEELYLDYGDTGFRVLGVMGLGIPSQLDNMLLFDMKSLDGKLPQNSLWVCDGGASSTVNQALAELGLEGYSPQAAGVRAVYHHFPVLGVIFAAAAAALAVSLGSVLCLWTGRQRAFLAIGKLSGFSSRFLVGVLMRKLLLPFSASFFSGYVLTLLLYWGGLGGKKRGAWLFPTGQASAFWAPLLFMGLFFVLFAGLCALLLHYSVESQLRRRQL